MDSKIWQWFARQFRLFAAVQDCTDAVPYVLNHPTGQTAESGLKPQSRSFFHEMMPLEP